MWVFVEHNDTRNYWAGIDPAKTIVQHCPNSSAVGVYLEPCYKCKTCLDNKIIFAFLEQETETEKDFEDIALELVNFFKPDQQVETVLKNYQCYFGYTKEEAFNKSVSRRYYGLKGILTIGGWVFVHAIGQNNRIYMPDGTDGLLCVRCGEYNSFVEPNHGTDFICPKHRISDDNQENCRATSASMQ